VVWFATSAGREDQPIAGRDHWPPPRRLHGRRRVKRERSSGHNALGEFVIDSPVTPQDLAATIYHTLGIPLHTWYRSQDGGDRVGARGQAVVS